MTYNPSFAIKVKNAFAEKTSQFVLLPTEKMTFKIEPLTYSSFKLIYNSHPFYGNFENLTFDYTYKASGSKVHSLNPQGGETIIPYGYYFGESFYEIFHRQSIMPKFIILHSKLKELEFIASAG